jgi:hypothetical protein
MDSTMSWFRANCGAIAWPACFALAFQLYVAFGHFHVSRIGDSAIVLAQSGDDGDGFAGSPLQKNPAHPSDEFCAICANIGLAGTFVLPILAIILAPRLFSEIVRWPSTGREPVSFSRLSFSARGPPHD